MRVIVVNKVARFYGSRCRDTLGVMYEFPDYTTGTNCSDERQKSHQYAYCYCHFNAQPDTKST